MSSWLQYVSCDSPIIDSDIWEKIELHYNQMWVQSILKGVFMICLTQSIYSRKSIQCISDIYKNVLYIENMHSETTKCFLAIDAALMNDP